MRAIAVYRALLRCYPAPFRQEYGKQMQLMFDEQLRNAGQRGGRRAQAVLWARALVDAIKVGPTEHAHVLGQDLRYALRTMAARPGFTATALLSLALGIGANTAIFKLWHAVLHAPLPMVAQPGQLVMLTNPDESGSLTGGWNGRADGPRSWVTYAEFEQLRDQADRFSSLMASQSSLGTWQIRFQGDGWEESRGRLVSGGFFEVLGVRPAVGRLFSAGDDRLDVPHAVISHAYWRRRFGGQLDALGKTFQVRNATVTVIGVTPQGFIGETSGQQPDFWLPIRLQPRVLPGTDRLHDTPPDKSMWLHVFGRLKPGVTGAEAEAQANAILQANLAAFNGNTARPSGASYRDERLKLQSAMRGASSTRREFSDSLTALLAGVGVLLLIACANLANLLLARGESRRTEIALRVSLGASRGRLVRQLITEALVMAAAGGIAALAVAFALHGVLVRMLSGFARSFELQFALDSLVLAFAAAATVASALLFGVLPAWQLTRSEGAPALNEHGRGAGGTRRQMRTGRWLVGLQLALSLPLLVGAGLLARTVYNLQRADLGYPAERLLLVRVDLDDTDQSLDRRSALRRLLRERLQQVPGVGSVTHSQLGVFTGGFSNNAIEVEGFTPKGETDRESAVDTVGPGYFSGLGVPITLGRDLVDSDRGDSPKVCVINDAFVRKFFAGRNPLGMRVTTVDNENRTSYQVVGVARNAHTDDVRGQVEPRYYVSAEQPPHSSRSPTFIIRTATDSPSVMGGIRAAIQEVDPALPIISAKSIQERLAPLTAQDRATAQLAVVFGTVALVLAAIGLYGVLSYGVARRTGEIAVRIALGAQSRGVIAMILRETLGVVLLGLTAGSALAHMASRLIDSRLFGVAPQDPLTLALAIGLLLWVALSAAYVPALRASRVDPMAALRQE
jgi:predicted permease